MAAPPTKKIPDLAHHHTIIGNETCESSFNAGHFGWVYPMQTDTFCYALEHGASRKHDAEHKQRQRFLLMPMNPWQ
jgi:hypothetical protein